MVARAWSGGPLREYRVLAPCTPEGRPARYDARNSPYVCEKCRKLVVGVYEPRNGEGWLCGSCRGER